MIPNSNCNSKRCLSTFNNSQNNLSDSECKCSTSESIAGSDSKSCADRLSGETSETTSEVEEKIDQVQGITQDISNSTVNSDFDEFPCSNNLASAHNNDLDADMEADNVSAQLDLDASGSESELSDSSSECNGDLQESLNSSLPNSPLSESQKKRKGDAHEEDGPCKKMNVDASASHVEKSKLPRNIIPSKDNPPPEMVEWLSTFQKWSNAERMLAIDQLVSSCEPTQVRYMMQLIEPQLQRDFISLLPKELALYVLSFLEPRDLLRAAQTCRNWRFLAEDNLLWREKCLEAGIEPEPAQIMSKRSRHRIGNNSNSPWKTAFIKQHTVEMNWRLRPIREPRVLKGHDDHVITCLQFSESRIVSGSDDNTLKVWSVTSGKCLRTLIGHTGGVWSSQMSGTTIISGSTDRTLKVWNAESGHCLHTLYGHTSTVRCMHLHGNIVVSGSRDATLRVWQVDTGECLHVLVGHLAAVRCVQYDGKLVVSGAYDHMVKVWNPKREECLHTLQGHTNRVYSLQFDGRHVVSGSLDTSIRVWEVESGACRHTLMGHQSLTSGMELRNNILVSGNADSTVKVWDILTGHCLQTLSGPNKHQSAVTCLQFNCRFVITSSDDGTVKLWDVRTGEFIRNLVALESGGSGGVVWRIRANDTKLVCAVGSRNGTEETKLLVLDFDVESTYNDMRVRKFYTPFCVRRKSFRKDGAMDGSWSKVLCSSACLLLWLILSWLWFVLIRGLLFKPHNSEVFTNRRVTQPDFSDKEEED